MRRDSVSVVSIAIVAMLCTFLLTACGGGPKPTALPEPTGPSRQQANLFSNDPGIRRFLGGTIAISADGTTCIVGSSVADTSAGGAVVFTRVGGTWAQQQILSPIDRQSVYSFGHAVGMSGDGNTVMVGGYRDINGGNGGGDVYVFTRSETVWSQQQILHVNEAGPGTFGVRITMSGDGTTALIGNPGVDDGSGAAYIFVRDGAMWSQQQRLKASDAARNDTFGTSVALNKDGTVAIIGAFLKAPTGEAYVFVRNGAQWSEQQILLATDKATEKGFGRAASISDDGNTALIGGYGKNGKTGVAYLVVREGTQWSTRTLMASDVGAQEDFGHRVAMSGDGNTAVVCAIGAAGNLGSAYLFTRVGTGWSKPRTLTPTAAPYDNFGAAVAISADGATVIIGAKDPLDDPGNGGAFVFV